MIREEHEKAIDRYPHVFAPPLIPALDDLPIDGTEKYPDSFSLEKQLASYYHILRHPETRTPLTLAIYGKWGSGKSSAMRWLKGRLDEWTYHLKNPHWDKGHVSNEKYEALKKSLCEFPRLITVEFCPWKYKKDEELWRGILSEVILAILEDAVNDKQGVAKLHHQLKRFAPAIGAGLVNALSVKNTFGFKLSTSGLTSLLGKAEAESKTETSFDPKKFLDTVNQSLHPEDKHLNLFEKELEEFVKMALDDKKRLVVFVDDLDRCEPDVAYQMLEAVKLYLNIEGIAFVFGVDQEVLQGHIRKRYLDLGVDSETKTSGPSADTESLVAAILRHGQVTESSSETESDSKKQSESNPAIRKADDYFKKLFNQEVVLNPRNQNISKYIYDLLSESLKGISEISQEADKLRDLQVAILQICNRNPREAKRLINIAIGGGICTIIGKTTNGTLTKEFYSSAARSILSAFLRGRNRGDWTSQEEGDEFIVSWQELRNDERLPQLSKEQYQVFEKKFPSCDLELCQTEAARRLVNLIYIESKKGKLDDDNVPKIDSDNPIWQQIGMVLGLESPDKIDLSLLSSIEAINLDNMGLSDISPLKYVVNLKDLSLEGNNISNLTPLERLSSLSTLKLNGNPVSNLWSIESLKNLAQLHISNTKISNLAPIQNLVALSVLYARNTRVTDISPLQNLTKLSMLMLEGTDVIDIGPIEKLKSLEQLELFQTSVSDLSPLRNADRLSALYLSRSKVSSIKDIENLKNLRILYLAETSVTDLSPLSNLINIHSLYLGETEISDLKPLAGMVSLSLLDLQNTHVSDLVPLKGLKRLSYLFLSNTKIADISPLSSISGLSSLNIEGTGVTKISPLVSCTSLTHLTITRTKVPKREVVLFKKEMPWCKVIVDSLN